MSKVPGSGGAAILIAQAPSGPSETNCRVMRSVGGMGPGSADATMKLANQVACRKCGRAMRTVAEIAPFGSGPGLVAFLCMECGTADSVLLDFPNIDGHADEEQRSDRH